MLGGNVSTVYRITDTFDLKIDNVVVKLSPLNYKIKSDMQAYVISGKPMSAAVLALKHAIKGISGLQLSDGSEYSLEFDADGSLSENSVNDLLNIPESSKLNLVAISLIHGMPQGEFLDPQTGKQLDGVKFVKKETATRKKK